VVEPVETSRAAALDLDKLDHRADKPDHRADRLDRRADKLDQR